MAARPRAGAAVELKNRVPASAMTPKASPMALPIESSSRLDRPVRPAPEAVVMRCTKRPVPFTAAAPARPAPDAADAPALAAFWEGAKKPRGRVGLSPRAVVSHDSSILLMRPGQHSRALAGLPI